MDPFHQEDTLGKAYDSKLMARLLKYAKPYWHWLTLCIGLLICIAVVDLAQPYIIKIAIDEHIQQGSIGALKQLSLFYLGILIIGFAMNYIQVYLLNFTGNKIVYHIREELFTHVQGMSLSFFDKNPVGRLVTRITNDTETLQEMYTNVLVNLFKDVFLLTGIVIIMLKLDYRLALATFIVFPFIALATMVFRKKIRAAYRDVRVRLARINSFLNENFTGMKTIHSFRREKQQFERFDQNNASLLKANLQEVRVFAFFRPFMEILSALGLAIIIWYGGGQVISENIEFGVLFAFLSYLKQFFQPINDLTEKYNILQSAMASSERIFTLLDQPPAIMDGLNVAPKSKFLGEIEFKNVWFAYEGENWVLRDINFKINPGDSVAFVGATGAGKSSIINLIGRFYEIQKGEILLDGINIQEIPLTDLRRHVGIVLQDVFMFTGTVRDNILLNQKNISQEEIEQLAGHVNAHGFIQQLTHQYDEPIMERGANLSTGQRQLISFARVLAFNPSILILDEATSNIDTDTEMLIQDAIGKLIKGRTSIAIAHRLSTIQNCNQIIVLHKGEIREQGSHQQLLSQEGIYYKLYQLQYKESFNH